MSLSFFEKYDIKLKNKTFKKKKLAKAILHDLSTWNSINFPILIVLASPIRIGKLILVSKPNKETKIIQ